MPKKKTSTLSLDKKDWLTKLEIMLELRSLTSFLSLFLSFSLSLSLSLEHTHTAYAHVRHTPTRESFIRAWWWLLRSNFDSKVTDYSAHFFFFFKFMKTSVSRSVAIQRCRCNEAGWNSENVFLSPKTLVQLCSVPFHRLRCFPLGFNRWLLRRKIKGSHFKSQGAAETETSFFVRFERGPEWGQQCSKWRTQQCSTSPSRRSWKDNHQPHRGTRCPDFLPNKCCPRIKKPAFLTNFIFTQLEQFKKPV